MSVLCNDIILIHLSLIIGDYDAQSGITERPRESASRRTDEKQKESREHAAGASVQVGSGEDTMSVTSPVEEPAPGHQEQRSTEHPGDQWQVSTYPCVVLCTYSY